MLNGKSEAGIFHTMVEPRPESPHTILILEDIPEVAHWLRELVTQLFANVRVTTAGTLAAARQTLAGFSPDLALVDLALPDGNGTDLIRDLSTHHPGCIAVVTTLFADDEFLFPALRAGAQGYLLKDQPPEKFAAALRRILDGEPPLSPSIAHRLLRSFAPPAHAAPEALALTPREREVLTLTAKGYRLPEVAEQLAVSRHTVSDHLKSIYRKLKVSSRAEATLAAARMGLVEHRY